MSRVIKFRGKRVDNGELAYGYYYKYCYFPLGETTPKDKYTKHCIVDVPTEKNQTDYEVDPNTVGQYTGLKDKNGVDVYEGDIVSFDGTCNGMNRGKYKVYWKIKKCGFGLKELEWPYKVKGMQTGKSLKVIGNIYNKE